jgi:hypothetical protein
MAVLVFGQGAGCGKGDGPAANRSNATGTTAASAGQDAVGRPLDVAKDGRWAPAAESDAASDAAADASVLAPPLEGHDLRSAALKLFRIAACGGADGAAVTGGDDPLAPIVDAHCRQMQALAQSYRDQWLAVAMPFIERLRPAETPDVVVYPFGGGDCVSALATFPNAREITTISLEPVGDVRGIERTSPQHLARALILLRKHIAKLFDKAHSRTDNLGLEAYSVLSGETAFSLVGLWVHGFRPTSLRYVQIEKNGTLRYVDEADLAKADEETRRKGGGVLFDPRGPGKVFSHVEIRFEPADRRVAQGERVLRHFSFNLDDKHLAGSGMLAHLTAKGRVSVMTKAASHLLWNDNFATMRGYLRDHMAWMISDTTGLPPRYATAFGFEQDVYGVYEWPEPFGKVVPSDALEFRRVFKARSAGPLPFRYGYPDSKGHGHIVVTRRP